ncbi:hypothetical protein P389DRAFT_155256 [Cystobasidium minutum MCA 4210]|uniref:uncharacterized protein n=1 Tax=Cystobasidium minutum MCA 4210 TaxID=1397322 RepID=UPI0034CEF54D|eukprot:jgi/Rhomi1/155256/estExt_Genewise1.C_7_t10285
MICLWNGALPRLQGWHRSIRFSPRLILNAGHAYSQKIRPLPQIDEADIEETFVRGSGPGGQSINKTNISVSLLHKPTGIRVQCHQTRSREWNRSLARKILRERVDLALNPGESKLESKWSMAASKKAAQDRKRRRKLRQASAEDKIQEPRDKEGTDEPR